MPDGAGALGDASAVDRTIGPLWLRTSSPAGTVPSSWPPSELVSVPLGSFPGDGRAVAFDQVPAAWGAMCGDKVSPGVPQASKIGAHALEADSCSGAYGRSLVEEPGIATPG